MNHRTCPTSLSPLMVCFSIMTYKNLLSSIDYHH
ncbi:hypothetical protein [Salmonella phage NINP13076]|nr:hypothetical protein [Salmonella phage NINP13076]